MKIIIAHSKKYGNKNCMVDDKNYEWLNGFRWSLSYGGNTFYCFTSLYDPETQKCKSVRMHRMIIGVTDPSILVDHKNHNGLDNQEDNIRISTPQENCRNMMRHKPGSSKYKGVSTFKNKWRARIYRDYSGLHIGYFDNEIDAAKAYDAKAKEFFGEFANLNFKSTHA